MKNRIISGLLVVGALMLVLFMVLSLLPADCKCCYCGEVLNTEQTIPNFVWWFSGKRCHKQCFWEKHPIPPEPYKSLE